ncbi:DJ-1/PfpI family protein [Oceanobacillus chungangensis]|uniref:AraC family transcriptional regulator n=1 Tax=Oceanobacillus chungangensis TaxID=1229152 RepID=A0A3D8PX78_9BACI|nr:DJ-1/PfpI family protein [Oceanobacillus chungangensis]RDW19749.1 AraC family transcriptional regulator [Oceanobacillus chungangensis]
MNKQKQVGILLYEYVDILDFSGPAEVLSLAAINKLQQSVNLYKKKMLANNPFRVFTVSETGEQIKTHTGIKVEPEFSFVNAPKIDILIIPGGPLRAVEEISKNERIINWIMEHSQVDYLCSVCTGAFILARTGVLNGKKAATHHLASNILKRKYPSIQVASEKVIQDENVITCGGVSSGINMALYLVEQVLGSEAAERTAKTIEFT